MASSADRLVPFNLKTEMSGVHDVRHYYLSYVLALTRKHSTLDGKPLDGKPGRESCCFQVCHSR